VKKAINTLKKAGCKCKSLDQNQLEIAKKNNLKIKHLTKVVHCEASTGLMNSVVWRVGLMLEMDKIYDIGIGKEYLGL
jgi:aspartate aminotransferase-like enzyme